MMSPLFYVSQLEVLIANQAPPARLQSVLADLRRHIEMMEMGLPPKDVEAPEENTASIPAVLSPPLNVPLDPPAA